MASSARRNYKISQGNRRQCHGCGRDASGVVFLDNGPRQTCSECAPELDLDPEGWIIPPS